MNKKAALKLFCYLLVNLITILSMLINSAPVLAQDEFSIRYLTYGFDPSMAFNPVTGALQFSFYDGVSFKYGNTSGTYEDIDNRHGAAGDNSSICFDKTGLPQFAYVYSGLMYAQKIGVGWTLTGIDASELIGSISSGLSSNGEKWISYCSSRNREYRYAHYNGIAWSTGLIDNEGFSGYYNSLVIDPLTGYPRVAYSDWVGKKIKYAQWNGVAWNTETIATDSPDRGLSLGVDQTGLIQLAYCDFDGNLVYATRGTTNWTFETIAKGLGGYALQLKLDTKGQPHIIYIKDEQKDGSILTLMYAYRANSNWSYLPILTDITLEGAAFTLNENNKPYFIITYSGASGRGLYLANNGSQNWYLNNDNLMYKGDTSKLVSSSLISDGKTNLWKSNQTTTGDFVFPAGKWTGAIKLSEVLASGEQLKVTIGTYYGSSFTATPNGSQILSGDGTATLFQIIITADSFTIRSGGYLACEIQNPSGGPTGSFSVITGGDNSYITSPKSEMGYPLPELAAGLLLGIGLTGLGGYILFKRKKIVTSGG